MRKAKLLIIIIFSICITYFFFSFLQNSKKEEKQLSLDNQESTTNQESTANEEWLKKLIIEEIPEYNVTSNNDWDKVKLLRDWTARNVVIDRYSLPLEQKYGYEIYDENLLKLFMRQLTGEGGFYCGGTAVMLEKVYELFGYDACIYNMVIPFDNGLWGSHIATLVTIDYNGKKLTTMNDAFLNYSVEDNTGKPLDMEEIFTLVKEKKFDKIKLNFSKKLGRKILENENNVKNIQISWDEYFYQNTIGFIKSIYLATGEKEYIYGVLFPSGSPNTQFERIFIKANQIRHEMGIPDTIIFPEVQ